MYLMITGTTVVAVEHFHSKEIDQKDVPDERKEKKITDLIKEDTLDNIRDYLMSWNRDSEEYLENIREAPLLLLMALSEKISLELESPNLLTMNPSRPTKMASDVVVAMINDQRDLNLTHTDQMYLGFGSKQVPDGLSVDDIGQLWLTFGVSHGITGSVQSLSNTSRLKLQDRKILSNWDVIRHRSYAYGHRFRERNIPEWVMFTSGGNSVRSIPVPFDGDRIEVPIHRDNELIIMNGRNWASSEEFVNHDRLNILEAIKKASKDAFDLGCLRREKMDVRYVERQIPDPNDSSVEYWEDREVPSDISDALFG